MIDLDEAWSIVHRNAIKAQRLKTIFHSVREHVPYSIGQITDESIEVIVPGAESKTFGLVALRNQLDRININAGVISYHDFFDNVAKESAVVFLHSHLTWNDDGSNIIDLNR